MLVLIFECGITTSSWYAEFALRRRVNMSAIGSVIVMGDAINLSRRGPRISDPGLWRSGSHVVERITSWTCSHRVVRRGGPSRAGRYGTARTCGTPRADGRTAGTG